MKFKVLCGFAVVIGVLCMVFVTGCSDAKNQQPPVYDPSLQPFEIHVWMDVSERAGLPERLIWEGIRDAHRLKGILAGRKIDLIRDDPGARTFDSLEAVTEFAREKGIDGAVLFHSSRAFGSNGEFSRDSGTFIGIVPSMQCLLDKGQGYAVQVGCSLEERARTAALFARNTLDAADAMIVLDQEAPDSIVLASMFSSEMIRLGGAISEVRILTGENTDLRDVRLSVQERNPGVIYMPYSEKTSLPAIELLQKQEKRSPIIVVNVPQEQRFLTRGGENLEGVYLVTDHRPRSTRSERAREYVRKVLRISDSGKYEEPLAVLGADTYFLLFDLLKEIQGRETLMDGSYSGFEQGETPNGMNGLQHSGRVRRTLHICRVETGLLRGPHLDYIESVDSSALRSWR